MFVFSTAANVPAKEYSDWYLFNTWLQKATNQHFRLEIPVGYQALQQAIEQESIDMIYASPSDTTTLVRKHGFVAVARPKYRFDEVVVLTYVDNPIKDFVALERGCRIALTGDEDVRMIGMILIEPADLDSTNVELVAAENGVVVAKKVMQADADIGFVLARTYETFSPVIKRALKVLIRSDISVINHTLLAKPHVVEAIPNLEQLFADMHIFSLGREIMENLGMGNWVAVEQEEVEFMIDLMETLK